MQPLLIYWSGKTRNTANFIKRLDMESVELSMASSLSYIAQRPYILFVQTYTGFSDFNFVPKPYKNFLSNKENRDKIRGVIASGDRCFVDTFCLAGELVAKKCQTSVLYRYELSGLNKDVIAVKNIVESLGGK